MSINEDDEEYYKREKKFGFLECLCLGVALGLLLAMFLI